MIRVGNPAPEFEIRLENGEMFRLRDLRNKHPLVLIFLPNSNSIDLPRDGEDFLRNVQEAQSIGAVVLAVCPSNLEPLRTFMNQHPIRLATAADPSLEVSQNFRVVWLGGSAIRRTTYVIDSGGIVQACLHYDLLLQKHWSGVLRTLRSLHSGTRLSQSPEKA